MMPAWLHLCAASPPAFCNCHLTGMYNNTVMYHSMTVVCPSVALPPC